MKWALLKSWTGKSKSKANNNREKKLKQRLLRLESLERREMLSVSSLALDMNGMDGE